MKDVLIQYMKRFSDLSESELKKLTENVLVAAFKKGTISSYIRETFPTNAILFYKGVSGSML